MNGRNLLPQIFIGSEQMPKVGFGVFQIYKSISHFVLR